MNAFRKGDLALQVGSIVGNSQSVLTVGTLANAVGENRFQQVEAFARKIELSIYH